MKEHRIFRVSVIMTGLTCGHLYGLTLQRSQLSVT